MEAPVRMKSILKVIAIGVGLLILLFVMVRMSEAITPLTAICPDHGIKGAFTGNRQASAVVSGKTQWSCEYSHPPQKVGDETHKFWSECQ